MWRAGLSMVAEHPLLGVGPGEVRTWYQHYRRPEAIRQSTGHLHNSPIQVAAERGLPALGAWLWFWIVFFREGWRILGRVGRESSGRRALVCASLAGVVGFLVAGLFEHNFGDAEVVMVVYALMAQPWIVARELAATSPTRLDPAPKPDTPSPFRSADRHGDRGGPGASHLLDDVEPLGTGDPPGGSVIAPVGVTTPCPVHLEPWKPGGPRLRAERRPGQGPREARRELPGRGREGRQLHPRDHHARSGWVASPDLRGR
jgi:O-Antigen ligase